MSILSEEEVEKFLKEFKRFAKKKIYGEDRDSWLRDLIDLQLTKSERNEIIFSFTSENYFRGPSPDVDRPGEVWEFGYDHDGVEIYIKLKLVVGRVGVYAKCISFHKAREPIKYMYKKGELK